MEKVDENNLTAEEQEDLNDPQPKLELVSYSGQDFDVNGIVRRFNNNDIIVPKFGDSDNTVETNGFQRDFVWKKPQMDKFIESLLLGYPVPGIFLVRQKDKTFLVLDGQQRIRTLVDFYDNMHNGKEFSLKNVADDFRGLTYNTLPPEYRRQVDDTVVHATILAVEKSPGGYDAIYEIFERLNSGGAQLTPHEIRVALYSGAFIDYLERLNGDDNWRALYGRKNPRLRDQELILRIIAMYERSGQYTRPLKAFLNNYANDNRDKDTDSVAEAGDLFKRAAHLIAEKAGPAALRKASSQVNTAQTEAIFVGLMTALVENGRDIDGDKVSTHIENLKALQEFSSATTTGTADEEMVNRRIGLSILEFGGRA